MMKIVLLVIALAAVASAGYAGSYGHGGHSGGGHGGGHGGAGYGGGHGGGWGWSRPYHGWASVQSHQTPYGYNYGLQESGKGYNKYVWQGADAHQSYGHGGGWGYQG